MKKTVIVELELSTDNPAAPFHNDVLEDLILEGINELRPPQHHCQFTCSRVTCLEVRSSGATGVSSL